MRLSLAYLISRDDRAFNVTWVTCYTYINVTPPAPTARQLSGRELASKEADGVIGGADHRTHRPTSVSCRDCPQRPVSDTCVSWRCTLTTREQCRGIWVDAGDFTTFHAFVTRLSAG